MQDACSVCVQYGEVNERSADESKPLTSRLAAVPIMWAGLLYDTPVACFVKTFYCMYISRKCILPGIKGQGQESKAKYPVQHILDLIPVRTQIT